MPLDDLQQAIDRVTPDRTRGGPTSADRFHQLKARANGMGWDLTDTGSPWRYVVHPLSTEARSVNPHTHSASLLAPADPDDPYHGMDSVSCMLDRIAQRQELDAH